MKNTTNQYRYFLESIFIGINILNQTKITISNGVKPKGVIYQNVLLRIITSSSTENTFIINQFILNVKRYEEIRSLTTGQGEDYTTWCLLDYDYIKNHYRLIAVDLSRQKELDADQKVF